MIINKVLNSLFSTWSNIAVVRALENYSVGISGREVARLADITPKNCLRTLTSLEELGVVNRIRGSREHLFTLNRDNYFVKEIFIPILEAERCYHEMIKKEISSSLKKLTISVYLFGSVARKEETISSDYDICIIYNSEIDRKLIEEQASKLSKILKKKFNVSLAPFYLSKNELKKRAKIGKSPVPEIINDGIKISGIKIKEILNG